MSETSLLKPALKRCALLLLLMAVLVCSGGWTMASEPADSIRVGILHSQTGTMAASELPVINATLLAIDGINAKGGLLGRQLEPVIADGGSNEDRFAIEAARLITDAHVDVLFGCWTSASRKAVKAVVESLDHLLIYPLQYEGLESSKHILYTGAAPNQQIIPAVSWAMNQFGKRLYLVGSDYVFPRVANWLINRQVKLLDGSVAGERYLPLGSKEVADVVADIQALQPDLILNTINGDSNRAFFRALKAAGVSADKIPVLSFSLSENSVPAADLAGQYLAWNYFESIDNSENSAFVEAYHQRFGEGVISDPMEAAWVGVHLWAAAVENAGSSDPRVIRHTIQHQSMAAPEGIVSVDQRTRHLWKRLRIARIGDDGSPEIVMQGDHAIKPFPYPMQVTPGQGDALLNKLFDRWGGQWSAPE